jgi:large subunit ribosomal protein L25
MKVFEDVPFKIAIPVILEGFPVGVKEGGKLSLEHRRIMVKALMKDMPDHLYINVENLELGKVLRVKDLQFDNLEIITPLNTVIASVKLTRSSKGMEAEEEAAAAAAAEGAAIEGAAAEKAESDKE